MAVGNRSLRRVSVTDVQGSAGFQLRSASIIVTKVVLRVSNVGHLASMLKIATLWPTVFPVTFSLNSTDIMNGFWSFI